jgi:hypothetical protein
MRNLRPKDQWLGQTILNSNLCFKYLRVVLWSTYLLHTTSYAVLSSGRKSRQERTDSYLNRAYIIVGGGRHK